MKAGFILLLKMKKIEVERKTNFSGQWNIDASMKNFLCPKPCQL